MRRAPALISIPLALALICLAFAGCGEKTQKQPSGNAEDREWLKAYVNQGSRDNPDFDHNSFDRISFAVDNQGNPWALVETRSFYKKNPSEGLFEANVFEKINEEWKRVTGGSGGFSEGVPLEVQKQWGIEGQ
jgi:hypothetical protein